GRLGIDEEMMEQARNIRDAVNPDETLFVVDAMIGQDAARVAEAFRDGVGFTGVVLSKLDGDARGGAALSITGVTQRPILFASTGESLDEFERFHPDRMANRILDMGDVLTLIEQAEKVFDQEEAEKAAAKLASGEDFTLDDFLSQMQQLKNMGSIKKMLGMMPNMGQYREALDNFDESEIGRVEAIIRSMTPQERNDPKVINGSRRNRIAKGSGTTVQQINQLLERFKQAQQMMKTMGKGMAGGGTPGMPGGPGMGMGKKSRGKQAPQKQLKKSKSKNPAKAAREQAEAAKKSAAGGDTGGSAFGGGAQQAGQPDLSDFDPSQLPPEMQKLLGGK
ncbi:MAG: signal recognition particle protein, partial [Brachybacterium sp.]